MTRTSVCLVVLLACAALAVAEYDVAIGGGVKLWLQLDDIAFARIEPGATKLAVYPSRLLDLPTGQDLTAAVIALFDAKAASSSDWERHEYRTGVIWLNYGSDGISWAWRDREQVVLAVDARKRFVFDATTEPGLSIVADLAARETP